jgi:hypothetical protein
MPNVYSSASRCRFAHFALRSSRRFLQFSLTRQRLPRLTKICGHWNAEEAVLSACSSLIAIVNREGGQVVQFSHFSVKEFLTSDRLATPDERLSCYHILPEPAHTLLAHACLSVLLRLDDKIDRNAIGHFPLALYAARHWVDHAQFRNVSSHIEEIMERLFDPDKATFCGMGLAIRHRPLLGGSDVLDTSDASLRLCLYIMPLCAVSVVSWSTSSFPILRTSIAGAVLTRLRYMPPQSRDM